MKLSDILEFAKKGYKPDDIIRLLEYEPKVEPKTDKPIEEPETNKPLEEPETDVAPEVDYKKLYEDSQNKLKVIQQNNVRKDASGTVKTDSEIALDFVNNLFK